jgi:histidine triad (HIT) family protein
MSDEPTCVFCAIAGGAAPAHIVDEDELSLAILDIQPLARGHCLVIPRRHVRWWHDLTEDETASLFGLARRVARRMTTVLEPDMVTLYARGRRIPHTHLFLVPTYVGDPLDRHFTALEGLQEAAGDLAAMAEDPAMAEVAARLRQG